MPPSSGIHRDGLSHPTIGHWRTAPPVSSLFPAIHIFLLTAQAQRLFQGSLPPEKTPSIAKLVDEESVVWNRPQLLSHYPPLRHENAKPTDLLLRRLVDDDDWAGSC